MQKELFTDAKTDKAGKIENADGDNHFFRRNWEFNASTSTKNYDSNSDSKASRIGESQRTLSRCSCVCTTSADLKNSFEIPSEGRFGISRINTL